jgi:hypothetical protein
MKKPIKYLAIAFILTTFIVLLKNDFQVWKLFGSEKQKTIHTKGKLCTYRTMYFIGFEVSKDTTCIATNN